MPASSLQHMEQWLHDFALRSLVVSERYFRDTHQWQRWRGVYHPDSSLSRIETASFQGEIDDFYSFSVAMGDQVTSKHFIQPVDTTISGDRALVISYGHVFLRATIRAVEYDVVSWGWWFHRALRTRADTAIPEWKLISLRFMHDRDTVQLPAPSSTVVPDVKAPPNARESYKFLDWLMTERGYHISKTIPGIDQPEAAERFREAELDWAKQGATVE